MAEKAKIIISEEELAAFESVHERKETLERQVRDIIKQAMKVQSEGLEELQKEQSDMWTALYTKYGVEDNDKTNYSIHRETRELVAQTSEDHEEGCGNPDCPVCSSKSPLGGLLKSLLRNAVRVDMSDDGENDGETKSETSGVAPAFKVAMPGKSGAIH